VAALLALGGCRRSNQETDEQAQVSSEPACLPPNPACQKMHSSLVHSEEVVVSSNGTLANAFVRLKGGVPAGRWTPF
jgi:hypothetical protein